MVCVHIPIYGNNSDSHIQVRTMHVAIVICVTVLIAIYVYNFFRSQRRRPPGPLVLPVVGSLPFIKRPTWRWALSLKSRYPDMFCYAEPDRWIVILNSYRAVHEAFIKQGDCFAGRAPDTIFGAQVNECGVALNDSPHWKLHRSMALHSLRDVGFGKPASQEYILDEAEALVGRIKEAHRHSAALNTKDIVYRAVSNVICMLVLGERIESAEVSSMMQSCLEEMNDIEYGLSIPMRVMIALIQRVSIILLLLTTKTRRYMFKLYEADKWVKGKVAEHISAFDPLNEPRDFIDDYLRLQHTADAETRKSVLTDKHLSAAVFDLLIAGTDTTTSSTRWALLLLALNPDVQQELHEQIDATIGRKCRVKMANKRDLPLLEAVIEEAQRCRPIAPYGIPRRAVHDTTLLGYPIPKDTVVTMSLHGVMWDEAVFPDYDVFNPHRFIRDGKYVPISQVIPFSIGKRSCLGESFARMELFLLLATLMQNFRVSLDPADVHRTDIILEGNTGNVLAPNDHKLIFQTVE